MMENNDRETLDFSSLWIDFLNDSIPSGNYSKLRMKDFFNDRNQMKLKLRDFHKEQMKKVEPLEAILWSIALPGFSQLLSGSIIKGLFFVSLEFIINVNSHFNKGIMLSFFRKNS